MPETGGVPVTRTPMLMLLARNKQRQVRPCAARALRVLFPDGGLAYCACALWSAARVRDHAPLKRPVVQPRNGRRVNHGPNADFPPYSAAGQEICYIAFMLLSLTTTV
jgi:hypothetical protein